MFALKKDNYQLLWKEPGDINLGNKMKVEMATRVMIACGSSQQVGSSQDLNSIYAAYKI